MTISLDLETTSGADLKKCGVYVYAADPLFAIQLMAYSIDGGRVEQIDFTAGELMSEELQDMLLDPAVTKQAYNAMFERVCLSAHLLPEGEFIGPEGWECTSVRACASGLPASLDEVCKVLGLEGDEAKKDGKRLIKFFAIDRNDPVQHPEKWAAYKEYNLGDVRAEMAIRAKIGDNFTDQAVYELDQRINDLGVMLDVPFIDTVMGIETRRRAALEAEVKGLTYLKNPNSPMALVAWLNQRLGTDIASANKATLAAVETDDPIAAKVLAARREMSLSSVKKFAPMRAGACEDGRARGLFRCYGAGRTGRWSSVRVQLQNLARGDGKLDLGLAKTIVGSGNLWLVEMCYKEPMAILSSLVRPSLVASPGNELIVGDFSSIEARVLAWYADEKWKLDLFVADGPIYETAASRMFNVPLADIVAGRANKEAWAEELRQKGKISELACGYQGGVGAFVKMGGEALGITEEGMKQIVLSWRKTNAKIVALWRTIEDAAKACIREGVRMRGPKGLIFGHKAGVMYITLPSGRSLVYRGVRLIGEKLSYEGYSTTARVWGRQDTYGGKLVENIVQATARDCLSDAMIRTWAEGYNIVMHVHDEIVADMPKGTGPKRLKELMSVVPDWAAGLPLAAKVEVTEYYTK